MHQPILLFIHIIPNSLFDSVLDKIGLKYGICNVGNDCNRTNDYNRKTNTKIYKLGFLTEMI